MKKNQVHRKRLAILLPDLRGGGAEMLRLRLASTFAQRGYEPEFWLATAKGDLLEKARSLFPVFDLNSRRIRSMFRPLSRIWRERIPNAVLVDMWPNTVIAAACFRRLKMVGCNSRLMLCDHNTLSLKPETQGRLRSQVLRQSVRLCYPWADSRVAVSRGVAEDLVCVSGISRDQFDVIYNPGFEQVSEEVLDDPWPAGTLRILNVGSMKEQKNQKMAIETLATLNRPDACLAIIGQGVLRPSLEALSRELGVEDQVILPGFDAEIQRWYQHADVFLLTSRWEGFGIVIVEALQHGLQVVSTDCRSGPAEILENGRHGKLVPVGDSHAMTTAIHDVLLNPIPPDQLRERAMDFSIDKIADQYLRLLFPN